MEYVNPIMPQYLGVRMIDGMLDLMPSNFRCNVITEGRSNKLTALVQYNWTTLHATEQTVPCMFPEFSMTQFQQPAPGVLEPQFLDTHWGY